MDHRALGLASAALLSLTLLAPGCGSDGGAAGDDGGTPGRDGDIVVPGDGGPTADGPEPMFPAAHPRIYLNAANKARLAAALTANRPAATRFRDMVDSQLAGTDHYNFRSAHAALLGAVTGTARYCDYAVAQVDRYVTSEEALIAAGNRPAVAGDSYLEVGELVGDLAMTYDWCFDRVTATQRTRWLALANQAVWNVWHHETAVWNGRPASWSGWSVDNPSNNYYYSFLRATMLLGLAARGEHPDAAGWITQFRDVKLGRQLLPLFERDLVGGGSREGTGYGVAMAGLFELYDLWEASTGEPVARLTGHTRASLLAMLHSVVPTMDRIAPTGDHARDSTAALFDYHRNYLQILTYLFRDDPVARVGKWFNGHSSVPRMGQYFMYAYDFMYDEPALTELAPGLALAYHAPGAGQIYVRSSWDTTATWLGMMAGPYTESHAHHDQGSLLVYKNEWLAYDQNIQSHSGIRQEEELHNLPRVIRNGATVRMREGAPAAQLRSLAHGARFTHLGANVTPIYDGAVAKAEREVVFIPPDVVVVFDRIDAAADATRVFQLNSPLRPTIAGARATFTGRMSTLTVDRILPAGTGATASVVDWSSDSDMGGGFRLDVTQTGAAGKSRFLHVLSLDGGATASAASDMGTQVGVDVTLRGGGHAGVRFESDGVGGSLRLTGPGGAVLEQATLAAGVAVLPVTP